MGRLKPRARWLIAVCLTFAALAPGARASAAQDASASAGKIRLDTVGYLPEHEKRATVAAACGDFHVVRESDGRRVLRGKTSGPTHNKDTGEALCVADFSAVREPGVYRREAVGAGASARFRVGPEVYEAPFAAAVRAMYLWRCGAEVRAEHGGVTYSHAACHTEDAFLDFVGGGHTRRDAVGGWHDAGDYNKYVVNAGVTVGIMLRAWEEFGPAIRRVDLGLKDAQGPLPRYLAELKWELDWLLKMQAADGSVQHKVSTRDFGPMIQPEEEKTERYFTPWSSAATADFVAMTAQAARVFRPFDDAYARRCLEAARKSYAFLNAHAESHRADLAGFTTGAYQTNDADDRLWAAAEMWETTGEALYLKDFETRARAFDKKLDFDWGWGDVKNLGMLTYLFSTRAGRDAGLVRQVGDALTRTADEIVAARDAHGYARPLGTKYYWGANGGVANTTLVLRAANRIAPKAVYVETALDAIHHLLGRNFYGRSFVTGVGDNPPLHPHDRRSVSQGEKPPWPGYLVGGGWPRATDWVDDWQNYRVNEIAINWNAPLIYALAGFLDTGR